MDERMTNERFLAELRAEHARWETLLARIPPERMTLPGVVGEWSVKDVVAHVTWHEREMVGVLETRRLAGSPLWDQPQHIRNAAIYAEHRNQPLAVVLAEAREVFSRLLAAVETLPAGALIDAAAFAEMPPDWVPWEMIAGNTFEHEREHGAEITAWLTGG